MPGFGAALFVAAALFAAPAFAQPEIFPSDQTFTVQPAFGVNGEGRDNISGATCMATPPGARTPCLVVNDSTTFAQIFTVAGTTIRPGATIGVTSPPSGILAAPPNMEGVGHDERFFYIVSSRGRPPSVSQPDTNFLVARFPIDGTASPGAAPAPHVPTVGGLQISDRIRAALTTGIAVPGVPTQQINRNNAQIEGIAVRQRDVRPTPQSVLHLGFRAPVFGGKAFIVSASADSVFATSGTLTTTVTPLALGDNIGIRDLAAVSDGLVILAGPSSAVTGQASVFHWNDTTGVLKQLAIIAEPANRNAEALVMLQEDPEFVEFLLMFDGVSNGGPLAYHVPR
jgi:hypothetical protein